ncbi:MAG: hypothetical protein HY067_09675 [Betaproteobacteria bacterium]|nr:hypothetical protein [Betaproteobacteria bacterium]
MMKRFLGACLIITSLSAVAAEPPAPADLNGAGGKPVATSHGLLAELESFLHRQGVDASRLSADTMVRLMIDWYRFAPGDSVADGLFADVLVYRYGGWSEGCATAFKLSLLRRVTERNAIGADPDRFAGITLMFEPSGQAELMPFTTASSDWKSIDAFLEAIESSPAFKQLAVATPMAVLIESGGLR